MKRYDARRLNLLRELTVAQHTLKDQSTFGGLLWSLLILLPTLFFGRFFCGWICPMGTLQ